MALRSVYPFVFLLFFAEAALRETGARTVLWAGPAILLSAVMIAWAAESAQYFVAQGFALAILAWLQTLPEFAVEAVLAWHQQVPLLLANLTGALRLLTGFGWPVIYFTAATFHRKSHEKPLERIRLDRHHAVEVVGLIVPLMYMGVVAWKGSLSVWDGAVMIVLYTAYLIILSKLPPEEIDELDDLERIPRAIVRAPRVQRITAITALFVAGGALIYFCAEPFLGSLLALAALAGVPTFVFVQWMAPVVSEFPEMASTFYWARTVEKAPMALMNMVSSNINQWTLLVAMLPIIYSLSLGHVEPIVFDEQQKVELLLTIAQAAVGVTFLISMQLNWWEALALFVLFTVPFASARLAQPVAALYFAWALVELIRMAMGRRKARAFVEFGAIWRACFRPAS